MSGLAELLSLGQAGLLTGFVVFLRVGAAMALLPAFGEQYVPQRIRLVLALMFTVVVTPAVVGDVQPLTGRMGQVPLFLAAEAVIGLLIGIGLRLFVLALQMAGAMAAQATSLAQIFGGSVGSDPQPAMGKLLVMAGLALAVMAGLHVKLAGLMILSYDIMPPGVFPGANMVADWGVAQVAASFSLAFSLAAPFVLASLVYNVALGVINRAMPQLMVAFVGAPAITAGALALMLLVVPILLSVWSGEFSAFLDNPVGARP